MQTMTNDTQERDGLEEVIGPGEQGPEPQTTRQDVTRINDGMNPDTIRTTPITQRAGGIGFDNYGQVIEFAKMMAETGWALPPHLRKSQTGCLAVCTRAGWWRLDPYFVAEHSYLVTQKGGVQKLAFDSAIFQAVINSRAPIKHRLKHRFEGEGDDLVCIVWTTFLGETTITEHRSPPLKQRLVQASNSPLWKSKERVQLAYDTIRDFARLYCQDVLGGIYDKDELLEMGGAIDEANTAAALASSPNLAERLPGRMAEAGMAAGNVERGLNGDDHPAKDQGKKGQAKTASAAPGRGKPQSEGADTGKAAKAAQAPAKPAQAAPKKEAAPPKSDRDWKRKPAKNAKEYKLYVSEWSAGMDTPSDILTRFNSERSIRNAANMVADETKEARAIIDKRIEALE